MSGLRRRRRPAARGRPPGSPQLPAAPLTYGCPGATRPEEAEWGPTPAGFRRHEAVTVIGRGEEAWRTAAEAVLRWQVKLRSGFSLAPADSGPEPGPEPEPGSGPDRGPGSTPNPVPEPGPHPEPDGTPHSGEPRVRAGEDRIVLARLGPMVVREPVRVVAVVDAEDRAGFAYGTRAGHPVCGEEAWVVSRDACGTVRLTLRSLTAAAPGLRGLLFPGALALQPLYRRRYLRSL